MRLITGLLTAIIVFSACKQTRTPVVLTAMVPQDTADKMIGSYLNSINFTANDTDLQSLSLDADAFRAYLNDPTIGNQVARFEISLAHTLDYINSGHGGQYAGYNAEALTVVVVGLDDAGNKLYYPGGLSVNNASHCPPSCGESDGEATQLDKNETEP